MAMLRLTNIKDKDDNENENDVDAVHNDMDTVDNVVVGIDTDNGNAFDDIKNEDDNENENDDETQSFINNENFV